MDTTENTFRRYITDEINEIRKHIEASNQKYRDEAEKQRLAMDWIRNRSEAFRKEWFKDRT